MEMLPKIALPIDFKQAQRKNPLRLDEILKYQNFRLSPKFVVCIFLTERTKINYERKFLCLFVLQ
jgi:hypothetical protein